MARQNKKISVSSQLASHRNATTNHEGGLAFDQDPRSRLYTRACASLVGERKFYTDAETSDNELVADIKAAAAVDPEFVLRLAAYAREVMNVRSTPIIMLSEAAAIPSCKPFVRKWTPAIVRRADEPAEVIAYWVKRHGAIGSHGSNGGEHAFPNSLTKGLADAISRFDEYALAKYDRNGAAVSLRDVLRIVRPKPKSEAQAALFRYLVKGEVQAEHCPKLAAKAELLRKETFDAEAVELAAKAHATWEVLTSKFGSKPEVWNALDLPFMAGLRNLANIMRQGADQALDRVIAMLQDVSHVRRSRQLPFRFFSAYRALTPEAMSHYWNPRAAESDPRIVNHPRLPAVLQAIMAALESSVVNLPRLTGRTFITADNSGSMSAPLSAKSSVTHRDVANLLAAIAHTMCDEAICSVFGADHAVVPIIRQDSIITNMARLAGTDVGHATNAYLTVRHLRETRTRVDRIILFSDMQCYDSQERSNSWFGYNGSVSSLVEELRKYRSSVNPRVFIYSVDLAGHGTSQFPPDEPRVALLAGWSERLLDFIPLFEADGVQAINRIKSYEPPCGQPSVQAQEAGDQATA